ncbi:hypothetical protein [Alloscardovia criceti]|uniref:hypothetical protein n=1 Tax=Alloscardovia criceti TaxID=356828 RepID=UPI00037B4B40|nr:hypothetical protein [Alloscardovia criceti]
MTIPGNWYEHHRDDGELLGWISPQGEGFVPIDLLGREGEPTDWVSAEKALENLGLGYLSEPFLYEAEAQRWLRVRIVEVNAQHIMVKEEDFGDITHHTPVHEIPFPPGERLKELV